MLVFGVPVIQSLGKDGMERPDPGPNALHSPWLLLKGDFKMAPPALTLAFPGDSGASLLPTLVHVHHFFPFTSKAQPLGLDYRFAILVAVSCWIYVLDYLPTP